MLFQCLVILDDNAEVSNSLSDRNGNVPSVWTKVFAGRVGISKNLKRNITEVFIHIEERQIK